MEVEEGTRVMEVEEGMRVMEVEEGTRVMEVEEGTRVMHHHFHNLLTCVWLALFPRPSHHPVFDCLQWRGKG